MRMITDSTINLTFEEYCSLSEIINEMIIINPGVLIESDDNPLSILGEMFKNAIGMFLTPIGNAFLLMIAKMTLRLPKSDKEIIDVFTQFINTHNISYTNVKGHRIYTFLPGIQITIKAEPGNELKINNVLMNGEKVSVSNFNKMVISMMKQLLNDRVYALWDKLSDKLKIVIFQKMFRV
jgi:chemotaxis protein CheY-P-specific phosphatase CheC